LILKPIYSKIFLLGLKNYAFFIWRKSMPTPITYRPDILQKMLEEKRKEFSKKTDETSQAKLKVLDAALNCLLEVMRYKSELEMSSHSNPEVALERLKRSLPQLNTAKQDLRYKKSHKPISETDLLVREVDSYVAQYLPETVKLSKDAEELYHRVAKKIADDFYDKTDPASVAKRTVLKSALSYLQAVEELAINPKDSFSLLVTQGCNSSYSAEKDRNKHFFIGSVGETERLFREIDEYIEKRVSALASKLENTPPLTTPTPPMISSAQKTVSDKSNSGLDKGFFSSKQAKVSGTAKKLNGDLQKALAPLIKKNNLEPKEEQQIALFMTAQRLLLSRDDRDLTKLINLQTEYLKTNKALGSTNTMIKEIIGFAKTNLVEPEVKGGLKL
jgi:hypothetical protein